MINEDKLRILRELTKLAIAGGSAQSSQQGPTLQDTKGLPGGTQGPIAQSQQVLPNKLNAMQGLRLVRRPQIGNAAVKAKKKLAPTPSGMGSGMPKSAAMVKQANLFNLGKAGIKYVPGLVRKITGPKVPNAQMPKKMPLANKFHNFRQGVREGRSTKAFQETQAANRQNIRLDREMSDSVPGLIFNRAPSAKNLPKVLKPKSPRRMRITTRNNRDGVDQDIPKNFMPKPGKPVDIKGLARSQGVTPKNIKIVGGRRVNPKGEALVKAQNTFRQGQRNIAGNELAAGIGRSIGRTSRTAQNIATGTAKLTAAGMPIGAAAGAGYHGFMTGTTKGMLDSAIKGGTYRPFGVADNVLNTVRTGGPGGTPLAGASPSMLRKAGISDNLQAIHTKYGATPKDYVRYNKSMSDAGEYSKMINSKGEMVGRQALKDARLYPTNAGGSKTSKTATELVQKDLDKAVQVGQ